MASLQVAVSGAVGKQVIPTTKQAEVKYVSLTPSAANATIKLRDGNASGEVVFFGRAISANGTAQFEVCHKFTKGMHVTVIGAAAEAYVVIN
jgi:hypothetical protein